MNKLNQILMVALLAQTALIGVTRLGQDTPKIASPSRVFADFEVDKATKLTVWGRREAGKPEPEAIVLEKSGASWVLAGTDGYPADETKVKELLEGVRKLTARGPVVSRDTYHKKLEVADEVYQRKVTITHDGKELSFFLGTSPGFKSLHLRKAGETDVLLVNGMSAYDVGTNPKAWISTKYVEIDTKDVWALSIKGKGKDLRLERSPTGDQWAVMGAPAGKAAKKSVIDELVRKAATVGVERPLGKSEKPEHGLASPSYVVQLVTGTSTVAGLPPPSTETRELRIGGDTTVDGVKQYYVKYSGSPYYVTAPSWSIDGLVDKEIKDLVE